MNILSEINELFPLVNMAGISFAILLSVEAAHIRFDYIRLPVDNTKGGSKIGMMKLFSESSIGVHWVQVDLTEGTNLTSHHVIVVEIVKKWKLCILPEYHVATM